MRSIFSWTLMFLLPFAASAQIPGYMGKKFTVDYSFGFSPAMRGPNSNGSAITGSVAGFTDFYSFNGTHTLSADYVVGRRSTIGIAVSSYKTKVAFHEQVHAEIDQSSSYGNEVYEFSYLPGETANGYVYYNYKPETGDMSVRRFSICGKHFGSDYIAPLGKYIKWELFALMHTTAYDTMPFVKAAQATLNQQYYNNYYNYYNYTYHKYNMSKVGDGNDHFTSFGIALELGKQRIFANSITMNYGLRVGYVFGGRRRMQSDALGEFNPLAEENYIKSMTTVRLFCRELFTAKIGIGFLR